MVVADSCYHAAATPSRSRVIHPHHHLVVIIGNTCVFCASLTVRGTPGRGSSSNPSKRRAKRGEHSPLADNFAAQQIALGIDPLGLDPTYPGLHDVTREGDPLADWR